MANTVFLTIISRSIIYATPSISHCSPLLGASEPFGDLLLTSGQYYDVLIFFKAGVGNASISWCAHILVCTRSFLLCSRCVICFGIRSLLFCIRTSLGLPSVRFCRLTSLLSSLSPSRPAPPIRTFISSLRSWSTPSRNKTVVPSTALYFTNQFAGSPYAITIWPNVIVPATTTVITTPLPYFIAGVQTSITIQVRGRPHTRISHSRLCCSRSSFSF